MEDIHNNSDANNKSNDICGLFNKISLNSNSNCGTGAGGKNTNVNGKNYEKITSIEDKLNKNGFIKTTFNSNKHYYYEKNNDVKQIIYLTQYSFKFYFKQYLNMNISMCPDEAYLTIYTNKNTNGINKYNLKILEKKYQHNSGSVDEKLKTGKFNENLYKLHIDNEIENKKLLYEFTVSYAFCINNYLKQLLVTNKNKHKYWYDLIVSDDIKIFYGDDDNYFNLLFEWINF